MLKLKLTVGLLAIFAGFAVKSSRADTFVQFNSPVTTVASPSTPETVSLDGTITNLNAFAVTDSSISIAGDVVDGTGDAIFFGVDSGLSAIALGEPIPAHSTVSVDFLTATLQAGQPAGFYAPLSRVGYTLRLTFSDGSTSSASAYINVTPAVADTPAASTPLPKPALAGTALLSLMGVSCLRRRATA